MMKSKWKPTLPKFKLNENVFVPLFQILSNPTFVAYCHMLTYPFIVQMASKYKDQYQSTDTFCKYKRSLNQLMKMKPFIFPIQRKSTPTTMESVEKFGNNIYEAISRK